MDLFIVRSKLNNCDDLNWFFKSKIMNIAILPARSGSQELKIKTLKTLTVSRWYLINIAKKSGIFEKIFITTDNLLIKKNFKKYGATDYILRSNKLSDNNTITKTVIEDAIKKFEI